MNYGIGSNFAKMKINEFSKILNFSLKNKVNILIQPQVMERVRGL